MAKAPALATCKCTECDFPEAEIKASKNGLLYRWCPDCNVQVFARTPQQEKSMRRIVDAGTVTHTETKPAPIPKPPPVTVTNTAPPPPKKGGFLDHL